MDHIKFSHIGEELAVPEGHLSSWKSPSSHIKVQRTSIKNIVLVTLPEVAEISINVVPVTKQVDTIYNCFAHLEVQFQFYVLSTNVEGVIGRSTCLQISRSQQS
jgi:hypothetical protein